MEKVMAHLEKTGKIILLRVLVAGSEVDRKAFTHKECISMGRDRCTDVHLEDPTVSRFHAVIDRLDHGFVIRDRSSNGTEVNGRTSAVHVLKHRDEIAIGRYRIVVEFHDDRSSSVFDQAQSEGWAMDDDRTLRRPSAE